MTTTDPIFNACSSALADLNMTVELLDRLTHRRRIVEPGNEP